MAYTLQTKKSDGTLEDVTIETITVDITSYKNKAIPSTIYNLLKNSQSSKVIVDNEIYYMTSNNGSVLKFSYCNETYLKRITINSNGSSWSIATSSLDNKLNKNSELSSYNDNSSDGYTDLTLLDKADNTLVGIPFRLINGESIIGKDPLTISGGGSSHPVYTQTNFDKWEYVYDKTYNNFTIKFTGEPGSRYIFNYTTNLFTAAALNDMNQFGLEIENNDVEVTFYNTVSSAYWQDGFGDPTRLIIYNSGLIFLKYSKEIDYAGGLTMLEVNGCDCDPSYIGNQGCAFDLGFPTNSGRYSNELYCTLRKDEVGTLHATIGLIYTL